MFVDVLVAVQMFRCSDEEIVMVAVVIGKRGAYIDISSSPC